MVKIYDTKPKISPGSDLDFTIAKSMLPAYDLHTAELN